MLGITMRRRRPWPLGAIFLVVGLALAWLHPAADAAQATPSATLPASALRWEPCPDVPDAQCAGLPVPIDPAHPAGPQVTLRLARLPAIDSNHSRGSLLIIPGGPGVGISAAGGQFVFYRDLFRIDELRKTYDVVTFDPRGIGQSSPIRCAAEPPDASAAVGREGVLSAAAFAALGRANAAFDASCFAATGALMGHLSAKDTAADLERIRLALGQDDGLVAYAGSYGTLYATAYLEQYGDHVKALVLDGVVDHSVDLPTYGARWALATEDGFDRFAQWCADDPGCALHGQDVAAVYDAVVAAHPEMRGVVRGRLSGGRNPQLGWPVIAQELATLARGEPLAATPVPAASPASTDAELASGVTGQFRGVFCADYGPQNDDAALAADNAALARETAHFAWLYPVELPGVCVGWPNPATNPPHRLQVASHPNVLVANPTHDPATPLVAAIAVWSQIPQARLLIADVDGHQSLPFSNCAYETQTRFLADPSSLPSTIFCPD